MIKRWLYTALLAGTLIGSGCSGYAQRQSTASVQSGVKKVEQSDLGVIVVDMQNAFLNGEYDQTQIEEKHFSEEIERELDYQLEILEAAKEKNVPIFVLEYVEWGPTNAKIRLVVEGYARTQFLTKKRDDGFNNTDLERRLKGEGVQQALLIGVNASACVRATAQGALKEGFQILTSPQLMANTSGITPHSDLAWYRENSFIYAENYQDILEVIAAQ